MSATYPIPTPGNNPCCQCSLIDWACFKRILGTIKMHDHITEDMLIPSINVAHDLDIVPIIGQACYDGICSRLNSTPIMLTQEDDILLSNIQKFAAYAVLYRFLESNPSIRVGPAGVYLKSAVPDAQATDAQYRQLLNYALMMRNNYRDIFVAWLNDNAELFPCYQPPRPNCKAEPVLMGWGIYSSTSPKNC